MDSGGKRGLPEMRKSAMAFLESYRLRGHHMVRGWQCEGSEEDKAEGTASAKARVESRLFYLRGRKKANHCAWSMGNRRERGRR